MELVEAQENFKMIQEEERVLSEEDQKIQAAGRKYKEAYVSETQLGFSSKI